MNAFQDLKELYRKALVWEKRLGDLYDVAEIGLKMPESSEAIQVLNGEHKDKLRILENVNVDDFGHAEWVKYPPRFDENEMVPKREMSKNTTPSEILALILGFQNRQAEFYQAIHDKLVAPRQKELFASLVVFKQNQAKGIAKLMEKYVPVDE